MRRAVLFARGNVWEKYAVEMVWYIYVRSLAEHVYIDCVIQPDSHVTCVHRFRNST